MDELIKKSKGQTITTSYSAPMSEELKSQLEEIRDVEEIDVNEHIRRFAKSLIEQTRRSKQQSAS